jgi:hypothetical protein
LTFGRSEIQLQHCNTATQAFWQLFSKYFDFWEIWSSLDFCQVRFFSIIKMRDRAGRGYLSMQKSYYAWTEFDKPHKKNNEH